LILTPKNGLARKSNQGFRLVKNQETFYPKDGLQDSFPEDFRTFSPYEKDENGILTPVKGREKDVVYGKKLRTELKGTFGDSEVGREGGKAQNKS
jgi:hypothetical protein